MRTLILGLITSLVAMSTQALAEGSMIGGGDQFVCAEPVAINRANTVVNTIGQVNGYTQKAKAIVYGVQKREGSFYITIYYPMPLSAPAYTVKIYESSCEVMDVTYSNFEG